MTFISPVVLDGIVSEEKLEELVSLGAEYPELDFKDKIDPSNTKDLIELACSVGSMGVLGGYLVLGVDNSGRPTGSLDSVSVKQYDEARLVPKLERYLSTPLQLVSAVHELAGHRVVVIFVGRHPAGCCFFKAVGQYSENGQQKVVFRKGDVFWRNGTRSERLDQIGFETVIRRRVEGERVKWLTEHQASQIEQREQVESALRGAVAAHAPLGAVTPDFDVAMLTRAVLEMARSDDRIAFDVLLDDAVSRGRRLIRDEDLSAEFDDLLDKLICVAAGLMRHGVEEWLSPVLRTLGHLFDEAFGETTGDEFGYMAQIPAQVIGPRVWLKIVERLVALGALAVRLRAWAAARAIAVYRSPKVPAYYGNWLRFGLTMASRASHLTQSDPGQPQREISLLSLARARVLALTCLNPDGIDSDEILSSVVTFDFLSNLAAVTASAATDSNVFYPSWARFRPKRLEVAVNEFLSDEEVRRSWTAAPDSEIRRALGVIGRVARDVGRGFDGFHTWEYDAPGIEAFLAQS